MNRESFSDVFSKTSPRPVCINPFCPHRTSKFYSATEDRRQFFYTNSTTCQGNCEPKNSLCFICVDCDKRYNDTLEHLLVAFSSGNDVELSCLPIFASAYRQQAVTIDDDENLDLNCPLKSEEWVVLERPLNGSEGASCDQEIIAGLTQEYVNELVASRLDPIMSRMMQRENESKAALRASLAEIQDLLKDVEREVEKLQRQRAELEAEFPRRLLIHCPEIDADWDDGEPRRPIPKGAEGGAASDPPLWATAENQLRAEQANVGHLIRDDVDRSELDGVYSKLRQPSQVKAANKSVATGCDDIVALQEKVGADHSVPPQGPQPYPELTEGMEVYAIDEGTWAKTKGREVSWILGTVMKDQLTSVDGLIRYVVQPDSREESTNASLIKAPKCCIAYSNVPPFRIAFGTRVIACVDVMRNRFLPGTVTEPPTPVNRFRYLIFFDKDMFRYCSHDQLRLIVEKPQTGAWEQVPRDLCAVLKRYLEEWPERRMLKLSAGQTHDIYDSGEFRTAVVEDVDASLALFRLDRVEEGSEIVSTVSEWIYRGSSRLKLIYDDVTRQDRQKRSNRRPIPVRSSYAYQGTKQIIQYTNADAEVAAVSEKAQTARKSGYGHSKASKQGAKRIAENEGKVVNVDVKPVFEQKQFRPHQCSPSCWGGDDVAHIANLKQVLAMEKPPAFMLPLKLGFTRQLFLEAPFYLDPSETAEWAKQNRPNTMKIYYVAPCGRKLQSLSYVHQYLQRTKMPISIDCFLFSPNLSPTLEFVSARGVFFCDDITKGLEAVPISCVNLFNNDRPDVVRNRDYAATRVYDMDKVNINTDVDFLVCCSCENDCSDPSICDCQLLTEIQACDPQSTGDDKEVVYKFRRLENRVDTGIFECNAGCKCKKELCFNRVAQNPVSVKLQLFKTEKKNWGVRALHDIPKGTFVATYSGQIFRSEDAMGGDEMVGDTYLAELDFIQINERNKEGYEPEVFDSDDDEENEVYLNVTGRHGSRSAPSDDEDFVAPSVYPDFGNEGVSRRQTRNLTRAQRHAEERSRPQGLALKSGYVPLLRLLGEKSPYVMDAKRGGNIGKYFNHSCEPNMFVQNVFVDTHDPRFTWLALFTTRDVLAGEELCWDYGYQVDSIPGRKIICYCGSSECRGRLL